jgi:hypothetical protein
MAAEGLSASLICPQASSSPSSFEGVGDATNCCDCSQPVLARFGPSAMSAIRSLSGAKRTLANDVQNSSAARMSPSCGKSSATPPYNPPYAPPLG